MLAVKVKVHWTSGTLVDIASCLTLPQDHAVLSDLVKAVVQGDHVQALSLQTCETLLIMAEEVATSKYADFIASAVHLVEAVVEHLGLVGEGGGVQADEHRCPPLWRSCKEKLIRISNLVSTKSVVSGARVALIQSKLAVL